MTILSQRDQRWKNNTLGFGSSNKTTIEYFGCTITSLAMLAGITPDEVNERLISVKGYAQSSPGVYNLIIWSKIKEALPWMEFQWRGYSYENDKVLSAINESGGCLVEVDGSRIGASKHWVLYVGDQQMHDPWYGTKKATSYYRPTGYATIKRIGNPPQQNENMPGTVTQEEYDKVRLERDRNWGLYQDSKKELEEMAKTIVEIVEPNSPISDVDKSLAITLTRNLVDETSKMQSEFAKKQKEWQQQEKSLEEENLELEKQVSSLKEELEAMKKKHASEIERLEKRIDTVAKANEELKKQKDQNDVFGEFLQRILDIFRRK